MAGRAKVKVNTNALGGALKGLRMWAAVLVLDPKAQLGIAQIAGPTLVRYRQ